MCALHASTKFLAAQQVVDMSMTSSQFQPVVDGARRIVQDGSAAVAARTLKPANASPLVAQLTVRAIQTALEKTHVNLPGTTDRAAVIALDPGFVERVRAGERSAGTADAADAVARAGEVLARGSETSDAPAMHSDNTPRRAEAGVEVGSSLPSLDILRDRIASGAFVIDDRALAASLLRQ